MYIILFSIAGALFGFFIHMVFEIWYINTLLFPSYETYSLGLSWNGILFLHALLVFVLTISGGIIGFYQGKYWWRIIYVEKKFFSRFIKK